MRKSQKLRDHLSHLCCATRLTVGFVHATHPSSRHKRKLAARLQMKAEVKAEVTIVQRTKETTVLPLPHALRQPVTTIRQLRRIERCVQLQYSTV
eukprot:5112527-Pyramimonas_sp.AAC.3